MQYHHINICGVERDLPLCPIGHGLGIASFVLLGDVEMTSAAAAGLADKLPDIDIVITAEAKGIPLAHEICRLKGMDRFVVARKGIKNYMSNVVEVAVQSITTKGVQHLYLDGSDGERLKGRRVCIIDDVISTGESLRAIEELARVAGANIVAKAAILAEGDAADRKDIIFLEKLPLFRIEGDGSYTPL